MKKLFLILFIGIIIIISTCAKQQFDMTIRLTNPQGKAVKYGGYYKLEATGDSVSMAGYTPGEYTFTMKQGDVVSGICYKDTIDIVDTLNFKLLANDEQKLDINHLLPFPSYLIFQFEVE